LKEIAQQLCIPLIEDPSVEVTFYNIQTRREFPFPWNNEAFFGVFPETFQQIPIEIIPPIDTLLQKKYDLVLLHYQVWFLSPSMPINSFLKSPFASQLLHNVLVITISGSRNMWAFTQEKIKKLLQELHAPLVGNIALTDRSINLISVITIVDWMFSGKKRKVYGFLPMPGVAEKEIKESSKFGSIILPYLRKNSYEGLQKELVENNAVEYRWFLVSMDKKANKMFRIWSKIILKNPKKRTFLLRLFKIYLILAIWVLSPIVHLIESILFPIRYFSIRKEKKYIQSV